MNALASAHASLPSDLVNFHWDPVTAAVAVRWSGVRSEERALACAADAAGVLTFTDDARGRPTRVVTDVDGPAFADHFLARVESLA
jgi:hypothetical protein